jgi:hypothetical protein
MANVAAAATVWNCPNYLGELFQIGAQGNESPFLGMMGGLSGGQVMQTSSFKFPTAQPWALEAAAQPAITETASLTAPTPTTYVRGQDTNTVQIFQEQVSVSYAKQSVVGELSGLSIEGENVVRNERDFQIMANLRQIAKDVNYSMLNGSYQAATDAGTAAKMRGIITATSTNAVAAGSVDLSKDLINELFRTMAAGGSQFNTPVIFASALDVQRISDLYGFAPTSETVGGVNVNTIVAPLAERVNVVWDVNVPAGTLLCADMSVCKPVVLPVPEKGVLFYEELSKTGASEKGQIYGQIGIDYGPEEYHGKITGLTTS